MRVLVAGATGNLGRALVDALLARDHHVVALARAPAAIPEAVRARLLDVRQADVTRADTLRGACDGVDVVVTTIGLVGMAALRARQTHDEVDHKGNLNLLAEAQRAGARKFVFVSALGVDDTSGVPLLEAKSAFEAKLRASGLEWLVVRPTALFDEIGDGILEPARRGVVLFVGDGLARVAPLAAEDAAAWIAENLHRANESAPIGGPDRFTYNGIAELCFQRLGKPSRIVHAPPGIADAAISVTRLVPGALHGELRFLRYAMTHDLLAPDVGKRRLRTFLDERATRRQ